MAPQRLTRKEKQAHTRSCLIESTAKVFARRGLQQASIDEVAEDAGFTKGAFYANFKSKEELFLAMLDQRFAERLEELDRIMHSEAEPEDQARQAGVDFIRAITADPEWERLFFEFTAYASRNEDFRQELVTRNRAVMERVAKIFEQRAKELDWVPPMSALDAAEMVFAMSKGIALQKLLDPESVSEELYGTMLMTFFSGLRSVSEQPAVAGPPSRV